MRQRPRTNELAAFALRLWLEPLPFLCVSETPNGDKKNDQCQASTPIEEEGEKLQRTPACRDRRSAQGQTQRESAPTAGTGYRCPQSRLCNVRVHGARNRRLRRAPLPASPMPVTDGPLARAGMVCAADTQRIPIDGFHPVIDAIKEDPLKRAGVQGRHR